MALIRNTAAMRLRGRVGNTTYYTEGGRQIARVSQNSSNYGETARRTESQQQQRAKWANLVNFYKLSKSWMPKAFENKKRTQSDYNRFMQLNLSAASVYLTRDMYAQGGCVVEPYKITEGSLRSIQVTAEEDFFVTDLAIGDLTITDETSVAALTQALIANNSHLREGVQISFISYQQQLTPTELPQVICTAYELTLDANNNTPARGYLPSFCLNSYAGFIATDETISTGCFAFILSDSTSGKTLVSTQSLINVNQTLISQYSSAMAREASIASYGVDNDVFLMSGSFAQKAAAGTMFIAGLVNQTSYEVVPVNSANVKLQDFLFNGGTRLVVEMSSTVESAAADIRGEYSFKQTASGTSSSGSLTPISVEGKRITFGLNAGSSAQFFLSSISVYMNGIEYIGSYVVANEHE